MTHFQWIVISALSVFAIYVLFWRTRGARRGIRSNLLWVLACLLGIWMIVDPSVTRNWANALGIGRGADLLMYSAIVLMFTLTFYLVTRLRKQSREITILTREIALKHPTVGRLSDDEAKSVAFSQDVR